MGLEINYDMETGKGRINGEFCSQVAVYQPRILRFLARVTAKYDLVVDSLDFDGVCRFRVMGIVKPASNAFKKEAEKIRALIDEDGK